jgi:hypothetical protein
VKPAARADTVWHRLDALLARLRPHRVPLSLAVDALAVVACWHATYLFRLGFERWFSARPGYDALGAGRRAGLYLAVPPVLLRVPKGVWRFSGFGEVQRLALACGVAGCWARRC